MLLQRWPPWLLTLLALGTVAVLTLALSISSPHGGRSIVQPSTRPGAIEPEAGPPMLARICVTRHGFCPVGAAPAGEPCGCPHPLRGSVPGHVQPLGGGASPGALGRDWPEDEAEDPLAPLGPLHGP